MPVKTPSALQHDTAWLIGSNLTGALLLFAITALIGRTLGAGGLGDYAVPLAYVYPLSLLADFGVGTLLTRDLAFQPERGDHALNQAARARLVIGGLICVGLIAAAPLLTRDSAGARALIVSAPLILINPFYSTFTPVFKARGRMAWVALLNVAMLAAQAALTLAVLASGGGVLGLLAVNTLTSAGQLAAAWALWTRLPTLAPVPAPYLAVKTMLQRAWPFALAAVLAAIQTRLILILLERLSAASSVGAFDAGAFTAASRFTEAARLIPNAYFGALFPTLAALAAVPALRRATFARARRLIALYGLAFVAGAGVLGTLALTLVFGPSFAPAAPVLLALAVGLAFSLLRSVQTLDQYAQRREARVNRINAGAVLLLAAGCAWAIPASGALGAAWVLAATEAVTLVALLAMGRQEQPAPALPTELRPTP